MNKIVEFFGLNCRKYDVSFAKCISTQRCPYTDGKCIKTRKSKSSVAIGTCTVEYQNADVIICPFRLLEKNQIFIDCLHLLTLHEPGNQIYRVPEVKIPGGNVDYFLVSARDRKVVDFVGIELQTLDTTGTIWPERQRLLASKGIKVAQRDVSNTRTFGMNWKMTAKTILVQMHHKARTFEAMNKHLALVVQEPLLEYMKSEFEFCHLAGKTAAIGDSVHIHVYRFGGEKTLGLEMGSRLSTDANGIGRCLGLSANPKMELQAIIARLEPKLTDNNRLVL